MSRKRCGSVPMKDGCAYKRQLKIVGDKAREKREQGFVPPPKPPEEPARVPILETTPSGRLYLTDRKVIQKCIATLDDMKFDDQFHFYTIEQAQKKLRDLLL
jgi:hypothetical protein